MSSPSSTSLPPAPADVELPATAAESDASCRLPLTLMFLSAATWLFLSALFSLIASIKCHAPNMMAECPYMTYGHLQAAANSSLIYGFGIQAGLGVMLWLFSRIGRTVLFQPVLAMFGAMFWNLGVTVGVVGIFIGDQSGFEWLEFPKYANGVLLIGYIAIGLVAGLTYHDRSEKELQPSQWYLLGALLWFPWIFSTAILLLQVWPARGVMQAVVNNWYGANLINIWFAFVSLAAIFYFIPAEMKRQLHSRYLAIFGFWTLALFGGWGGMNASMPVPAWLPGLTSLFTVATLVPILAVAWNLHFTFAREFHRMKDNPILSFMIVGAFTYVTYGALNAFTSVIEINTLTHFTYFGTGVTKLAFYGFIVFTLSGAIYHIAPRITGTEWPRPGLIKTHLWVGGISTGLLVAALCAAGLFQSYGWSAGQSFMETANSKLVTMSFRMSTLGELFILVAVLVMVAHLKYLLYRCCRECCARCVAEATKPKASEVLA